MSQTLRLRYDPRLIEESVFLAQRSMDNPRNIREERERIYEISDPEERERRFAQLYYSRFVDLRLTDPIEQTLQEQPTIAARARGCFVVFAAHAQDEGAELFVASDEVRDPQERFTIRLLLRPKSLLDTESLLTFLRHELFHIADMLDPAFAYEPALPASEVGPTYDSLLRDRYRTLWDTTINGRMVRRGWLPGSTRSQYLSDFAVGFPMLGDEVENVFARFFDQGPHSHPQFVAFSQNPRAAFGDVTVGPQPGSRCLLCGFPTYTFAPQPERLDRLTIAEIVHDFPHWHPSDGLCTQCADLYRVKWRSMEAAKLLPGWHPSSSKY
jgi:hypothetical protein